MTAPRRTKTIVEAMQDPRLFARWFTPWETWATWAVVLKVIFALPLAEAELETFRELTGRTDPPADLQREAWLVVGRRGGKSLVMALLAVYMTCFRQYRLTPGERGVFMLVAADKDQAETVLSYARAFLEETPLRQRLDGEPTKTRIRLKGNLSIWVRTRSFKTVRGFTVLGAGLDEVAFWSDEESANPDEEVVAAIRPATATVPEALIVGASSPYARRGVLWKQHQALYGKESRAGVCFQGDTRTFNPAVPEAFIAEEYGKDPVRAAAEYGAQFRTDVESFVGVEAVDAAIIPGRLELHSLPDIQYRGFCDPSGGSVDSMTLAIAHEDGGRGVLDLIREVRPPFSPEDVVKQFSRTLKDYGLASVTGDRYGSHWVSDAFQREGVHYVHSEAPKSEIYGEFLPMLNSGRVDLLDHKKLRAQLLGLERRTARSGKDSIDHAPGAHDDVVNAVAGVLHGLLASTSHAQDYGFFGSGATSESGRYWAWGTQ